MKDNFGKQTDTVMDTGCRYLVTGGVFAFTAFLAALAANFLYVELPVMAKGFAGFGILCMIALILHLSKVSNGPNPG